MRIFKTKNITVFRIACYGSGNLGFGLISQMLSSYLVFYATVILRMPGSLIGLIISISVIWDAVSDPLMGYISDNTHSRFGRRHIYILLGTVFASISNIILWNVSPDLSMFHKFSWILTSVLMVKTFMTVFVTPYTALGAELSSDYNERTTIQTIKTLFFLFAILINTAGFMFIIFRSTPDWPMGQLNPQSYKYAALTASIIMLFSGLITYTSTKEFIPILAKSKSGANVFSSTQFVKKIKFNLSEKDYRAVFFGFLFTNMASAIITTIGLHTFTYSFYLDSRQIGVIFGVQFLVCILAQPIWAKIAERIDKKNAIQLGLKISILGCLILFALVMFKAQVRLNYLLLLSYAIVTGFGSSGLFSIPYSMIADTVDQQEYKTSERNEGVYYGMLTFGYKISQSITIFIFGIVLDLIKFDPSLTIQKNSTATMLGVFLSLGSITVFTLAALAYSKYNLDRQTVQLMQDEINEFSE